MSAAECARFEKKLAYFSAPSLLGIKCANLISIGKNEFNLPEHIRNFNTKAEEKLRVTHEAFFKKFGLNAPQSVNDGNSS